MKLRLRILGLALAWMALITPAAPPRIASWWIQGVTLWSRGPAAWRSASSWSVRSRWLGPAGMHAQRFDDGCGAASLAMVLHGRSIQVSQSLLYSILRRPRGGTTLGAMARTARRFGIGCDVRWESLQQVPTPAIVHLRRLHFVVLRSIGPEFAEIFDPAYGWIQVRARDLDRQASGAVLVFEASGHSPLAERMEDE